MNDRASRQEKAQLFLRDPEYRKVGQEVLEARARAAKRQGAIKTLLHPKNGQDIDVAAAGGGDEQNRLRGVAPVPLAERLRYRREFERLSPDKQSEVLDAAAEEHRTWEDGVIAENARRRQTGTGFLGPQPQDSVDTFPDRMTPPDVRQETRPAAVQKPIDVSQGSPTLRQLAEKKRVAVPSAAVTHEEREWVGAQPEPVSEREPRIPVTVSGVRSTGTGWERRPLLDGKDLVIDLPEGLGSGRILVAKVLGAPDDTVRLEVSFTQRQAPASLRGASLGDAEILVTPLTERLYADRKRIDRSRGTTTLVREIDISLPPDVTWEQLRPLFETT